MKAHNFFTEIAFIPWNYKRSDPRTVRLFAENRDYYAICVHGCNHLGNEFGGGSYQDLSALASVALWRMEQHKKITGLPYDPVMVFPRGRFSSTAMKALKDQGYFAAFNSTIRATDSEKPADLEYQRPFTLVYHNFPLFLRRSPMDKARIANDMASGRPVIIVEHHGAFKNGYKAITDFVEWVNGLGNVKWTSLLNIAEHYLGKKFSSLNDTIQSPSPLRSKISAKTIVWRFLSEVRDNYLETSNLLTKAYKLLGR